MNTLEAFQHLVDNWDKMDRKFTTKYRWFKHKFLRGGYLSEKKMEEILMQAGYVSRPQSWSTPLS